MRNATGKALLIGVTTALALTVAAPAQAAPLVDKGKVACARKNSSGKCTYSIGLIWVYKKGSNTRTLTYVDADLRPYKKGSAARWLYKKPGGTTHVGKSWQKSVKTSDTEGSAAVSSWGSMTATTGPKFPKNTQVCIQFKGYRTTACLKLT